VKKSDLLQRIDAAVRKHSAKDLKKNRPRSSTGKRNQQPEKEVVKDIMNWLGKNRFYCNVIEAKAVYSVSAGRYLSGQVSAGYSDISGNDCEGLACYIEAKAPGKRATLRSDQREFLESKVQSNCFAVCVDGVHGLADSYGKFKNLTNLKDRRKFLTNLLPKPRSKREKTNREDDFI